MHNNKAKQTQTQLGYYILNLVKKDKEFFSHFYLCTVQYITDSYF
jgi:hypothetical protein